MTCKICGQKLSKCCCTADDVKQYSDKLEEEMEELEERVQELENANQKLKGDVLRLNRESALIGTTGATSVAGMVRDVTGDGGLADRLQQGNDARKIVNQLIAERLKAELSMDVVGQRTGWGREGVKSFENSPDAKLSPADLSAYAFAVGHRVFMEPWFQRLLEAKRDIRLLVRAAVRAYLELNTIRARDGVPWTKSGGYCCRAGVDEEYFSSVVDGIDAAVRQATGLPAHCHPELYVQEQVCQRCEGDGKAHGSDRPFEWTGPGTVPGPCPVCKGSGKRVSE